MRIIEQTENSLHRSLLSGIYIWSEKVVFEKSNIRVYNSLKVILGFNFPDFGAFLIGTAVAFRSFIKNHPCTLYPLFL